LSLHRKPELTSARLCANSDLILRQFARQQSVENSKRTISEHFSASLVAFVIGSNSEH